MAAIDDEIGTLAEFEQRLDDIGKDFPCIIISGAGRQLFQIAVYLDHHIEELLVVLQARGGIIAFRERVDIGQKSYRSSFGDWPELNDAIAVVNQPGEEAAQAAELLQRIRQVAVGNPDIAGGG